MATAYDNSLYQSSLRTPAPDLAISAFEARYNAAYSSQPNTPSSGRHAHVTPDMTHNLHKGNIIMLSKPGPYAVSGMKD